MCDIIGDDCPTAIWSFLIRLMEIVQYAWHRLCAEYLGTSLKQAVSLTINILRANKRVDQEMDIASKAAYLNQKWQEEIFEG